MTLFQTETVPSPLVLEGVVITDALARSVAVRLPTTTGGGDRLWWRTAHTAMAAAVEDGWRNHPYVWASTPSVFDAVHVQPADFLNVDGDVSGRHRRLFGTDFQTCVCAGHNRSQ